MSARLLIAVLAVGALTGCECGERPYVPPRDAASDGSPDASASCGNAIVEPGETCDTAIAQGEPGACPTSCDDGAVCTADAVAGSGCALACTNVDITACANGDGCCATSCTPSNDSDCSLTCGNGTVEGPETCDTAIAQGEPGACPTSCDDGIACTTDRLVGSGCSASCSASTITTCQRDGCCPAGCTPQSDTDCRPVGCTAEGDACSDDADCCNGFCSLGTCAVTDLCSTRYEPCTGEGLNGACCSLLCLNTDGAGGVPRCQPIDGCRVMDELCATDADCCTGMCQQTGTTTDARPILRCVNWGSCIPVGDLCNLSSATCCMVGQRACEETTEGVSRCFGGSSSTCIVAGHACTPGTACCTDPAGLACTTGTSRGTICCLPSNSPCAFSDLCCSGTCSTDADGTRRCT